jgi:hypothetical protein
MSRPARPPEPEIHSAARLGDVSRLEALVSAGNRVDAEDAHGSTPMDEALGGDGESPTAVRVLRELGAVPRVRR